MVMMPKKDLIKITIEDSGIGMTETELENLN